MRGNDEPSERMREEARRYNDGLSSKGSLMALRAAELRRMVDQMWPKGRRAGQKPAAKAGMAEYLLSRMPAHRASYRVRFAEPVPVGAVEIKRRADAAVAAFLSGRSCPDLVEVDDG